MGSRRTRHPFTLIEIVLVFTILASISTLLLTGGKQMLTHYQFGRNAKRLEQEIALSETLAQISQADILLTLKKDKRGRVMCIRTSDEPLVLPGVLNAPTSFPYLRITDDPVSFLFTGDGWSGNPYEFSVKLGKNQKKIQIHRVYLHPIARSTI